MNIDHLLLDSYVKIDTSILFLLYIYFGPSILSSTVVFISHGISTIILLVIQGQQYAFML